MPASITGMEKILIDSSVWVSYLAIDSNSKKAIKLFDFIYDQKSIKIKVPEIIFLEVINSLIKLHRPKKEIQNFKNTFKLKTRFQLVKTDKKIYRKAARVAKRIRLKTLDLLILTSALHLKVDHLYTFDKKLQKAYKFTKNL